MFGQNLPYLVVEAIPSKNMLVKLDDLPRDRGENQKI